MQKVALGAQHTLFLDSKGAVYSCGENKEVIVPEATLVLALERSCPHLLHLHKFTHQLACLANVAFANPK